MTRQPHRRARKVHIVAACVLAAALTQTTRAQQPVAAPSDPAAIPPKTQSALPPPDSPAISHRQTIAASDAYVAGARALEHNDLANAEAHFSRASKLDPANADYTQALTLTRERHLTALVQQAAESRLHGKSAEADALLAQARTLDPQNSVITQHTTTPRPSQLDVQPWLPETPALAGVITLKPDPAIKSFHIKSDSQEALRQLTQAYGIRAVFDPSVPHQNLRFDLEDIPYTVSAPILYGMAKVFAVPLDPKTLLFAQDTADNRQRFERQVQETVYVPGQTVEQINDLASVIRNLFDVKQLTVQPSFGSLVLRAPEADIKAINLTLADLIDGGSEVILELKLYSVDTSNSRDIGFQPPQFGAYNVTAAAQQLVSANQTLINQAIAQGLISSTDSVVAQAFKLIASGLVSSSLLSSTIAIFGGSIDPTTGVVSSPFTTTGITTTSSFTFNLSGNISDTRALEDVQVRVGDRQSATFRAGMRYPITTSTYSTPSASSLAGISVNGTSAAALAAQYLGTGTATTIPQISYEDLGLTLKATPNVQKSGRVAMKLDLKLEALGGSALNNIPILNSRTLTSDITVNEGETALLVSTVSKSEAAAVSGLPGLTDIPGFRVPTEDNIQRSTSELILLITPHVVRHRSPNLAGPRIAVSVPPSSRTQ